MHVIISTDVTIIEFGYLLLYTSYYNDIKGDQAKPCFESHFMSTFGLDVTKGLVHLVEVLHSI